MVPVFLFSLESPKQKSQYGDGAALSFCIGISATLEGGGGCGGGGGKPPTIGCCCGGGGGGICEDICDGGSICFSGIKTGIGGSSIGPGGCCGGRFGGSVGGACDGGIGGPTWTLGGGGGGLFGCRRRPGVPAVTKSNCTKRIQYFFFFRLKTCGIFDLDNF